MNYIEAIELEKKVDALGCHEALGSPLKAHPTARPMPDVESTVACKLKLKKRVCLNIHCTVIDGSKCPAGISVQLLKSLNSSIN